MTATLPRTDRWAAQPAGFNRPAAEAVYQAIAGCPDDQSAALVSVLLLDGMIQHELVTKGHQMAAAADRLAKARADALEKRLASQAVAKARRHQSAEGELAGIALLHKAFEFSDEERSRFTRDRTRDLRSGRFVREHRPIDYDPRFRGITDREARQVGITEQPSVGLSEFDRARFQQAYHQIAQTVRPFLGMGQDALIHLDVHDAAGPKETRLLEMPNKPGDPLQLGSVVKPGEHVAAVAVSVVPPTTAAGAVFDALAPLSPTAAGVGYRTVAHGAGNAERLGSFRGELETNYAQDDYIPSQRIFRNIESSSRLLSDSLGPVAPPKLKLALKVGEHVGKYGPEAQKVIGPTADRTAYRYRGTERALPEPLANSIAQLSGLEVKDKGWYLTHGNARPDGEPVPGGWNPSGVLQRFREMLPNRDLNDLHLKSGAVPPSRGVVFDKDGRASVLAVGYGDDHYLPFNLRGRSFRAMKGGEYIRTRTFGGPTTEDIYTSLIGGARRYAVVSHNGVYTVDYAADLKGGKRFNDNAARMVGRYGYLLDAVKSKQVTTGGVAASRRAELAARAEQRYPEATSPDRHKEEYERLLAHEVKHPELSQQQKDRAALDFFAKHAELGPGAGGMRQTMIASYINTEASDRWLKDKAERDRIVASYPAAAAQLPPIASLEQRQSQVQDEISGMSLDKQAQRYAEVLNLGDAFAAHMKQAEADNKARLTPLSLNGEGYEKALQALQEEFPHYITDVQFHPWSEANRGGRSDTGYVRPRHNRAAAALSGYFDTHVARGEHAVRGKVYADSTRWQNRNSLLRPFEPKEEAAAAKASKTGAATKSDPGTAAALREDADFALFDAIKEQDAFSGNHKPFSGLESGALGGLTVTAGLADPKGKPVLEKAAPNLINLHQMSRPDFETAYRADPDKMRRTLASAKRENDATGLLDIKPTVAASFERGGRPAPKRELGQHASAQLNNEDGEFDFDGEPAYDAAMSPKTGQIEAEYGTHPFIKALVDSKDLPESLSDTDFGTAADRVLGALRQQRKLIMSRAAGGEDIPDEAWRRVDEPAEGLLRARQLRRRLDRAAEAEREASALTPQPLGEPAVSSVTQFMPQMPVKQDWMSDEDYSRSLDQVLEATRRAMGEEPDPNAGHRVIEQ